MAEKTLIKIDKEFRDKGVCLNYLIIEENIENWCKKNNYNILRLNEKNLEIIYSVIARRSKLKVPRKLKKNYTGHIRNKKRLFYYELVDNDFYNKLKNDLLGGSYLYGQEGMPDYVMWNSKWYFLVEYKSLTDDLRPHQIEWFLKHKDYPTLVIRSLKKGEPKKLRLLGNNPK